MDSDWTPRIEDFGFEFLRGPFEEAAFDGRFLAAHPIVHVAIGYAIAIREFMTTIEEVDNVAIFNLRIDQKHDVRWHFNLETSEMRREVLADNQPFRCVDNLPNPMISFAQGYNEQVAQAQIKRMEFKTDRAFEQWCLTNSDYAWMIYKSKSSMLHKNDVPHPFRLAYMSQHTKFAVCAKSGFGEKKDDPAYKRFNQKVIEKARQVGMIMSFTPEVFLNV